MARSDGAVVPPGFVHFAIGRATVVCADYVAAAMRTVLARQSLYDFAAHDPGARPLQGRGIAYAVTLPADVERVVVRHNRRGGLFAPITRDLFRAPSRAPYELITSERLRRAGVSTPTMLGYVLYAALGGLCRVDVLSREVADSFDLAALLMDDDRSRRDAVWPTVRQLLSSLNEIGALHRDLNAKNILLRHASNDGYEALVLDVDRVEFAALSPDVGDANRARLVRSLRKWRVERGARITNDEIDALNLSLLDDQIASPASSR